MNTINLKESPTRTQTDARRQRPSGAITRDGGMYAAGLIEGASLITRGEALGHEMWIDNYMLGQVSSGMNDTERKGRKARFKHPGLSSDGTGKLLGRFQSGRLEGDQVYSDLHFAQSAHDTPSGDLAGYVMNVAEETPDLFGTSIVFRKDHEAERQFMAEHSETRKDRDGLERPNYDTFQSPDPENLRNLPHARVRELLAADVVDDPAANPEGMFSAELGEQAALVSGFEQLMEFALGMGDEAPDLGEHFPIHPDRARAFVKRFLLSRNLKLDQLNKTNKVNQSDETNIILIRLQG